MNRTISFALGNLWRWNSSSNRNCVLKFVRKLVVSGVEITFSSKEELYSFRPSPSNLAWLKNLNYVSIHAPFKLVSKAENEEEVFRQLDSIANLYKEINAKNVIIHPQELPKPEILAKYKFNVSTENMTPKKYVSLAKLGQILNQYPKMGLCLDISHAYRCSAEETRNLVEAFEKKITQIHFSGTYRQKDHQSLQKVSQRFFFSLEPIKKLKVPIIIEEEVEVRDLLWLKKEVVYVRNLLTIIYQPD